MPESRTILAVLEDLFFTVKINEAAKRAGMAVKFVKSEQDALEAARTMKPALILIDLNFHGVQPLDLIARLKGEEETRRIDLVGYVSHVQGDLKQRAQEAGCDVVLARSTFSQNLPMILKRHA
jgi:PleD family two-component response regulator